MALQRCKSNSSTVVRRLKAQQFCKGCILGQEFRPWVCLPAAVVQSDSASFNQATNVSLIHFTADSAVDAAAERDNQFNQTKSGSSVS